MRVERRGPAAGKAAAWKAAVPVRAARMALTGNAAIVAAHGKARASGWKGAKPLRVTGAWAGTTETTGTTRRCLGWCFAP